MVSMTPEVRLITGPAATAAPSQDHRCSAVQAARLLGRVGIGLDGQVGIIQCKFHGCQEHRKLSGLSQSSCRHCRIPFGPQDGLVRQVSGSEVEAKG